MSFHIMSHFSVESKKPNTVYSMHFSCARKGPQEVARISQTSRAPAGAQRLAREYPVVPLRSTTGYVLHSFLEHVFNWCCDLKVPGIKQEGAREPSGARQIAEGYPKGEAGAESMSPDHSPKFRSAETQKY